MKKKREERHGYEGMEWSQIWKKRPDVKWVREKSTYGKEEEKEMWMNDSSQILWVCKRERGEGGISHGRSQFKMNGWSYRIGDKNSVTLSIFRSHSSWIEMRKRKRGREKGREKSIRERNGPYTWMGESTKEERVRTSVQLSYTLKMMKKSVLDSSLLPYRPWNCRSSLQIDRSCSSSGRHHEQRGTSIHSLAGWVPTRRRRLVFVDDKCTTHHTMTNLLNVLVESILAYVRGDKLWRGRIFRWTPCSGRSHSESSERMEGRESNGTE